MHAFVLVLVCNMSHVTCAIWTILHLWLCRPTDRLNDRQTDKQTHEHEALEFKHKERSCDVAPPIRNHMHTSTFIDQTISSIIQKYFNFSVYLPPPVPPPQIYHSDRITICVFLSRFISIFGNSKSILMFEIYDAKKSQQYTPIISIRAHAKSEAIFFKLNFDSMFASFSLFVFFSTLA